MTTPRLLCSPPLVLAAFLLVGCGAADRPTEQATAMPFGEDAGPAPTWNGYERSAHFVTMRDGVRLAVDVLLPTDPVADEPRPAAFPAVFEYTPYQRSYLMPQTGEVYVPPEREFFLQHGYAYVSADFRGTGASFGFKGSPDVQIADGGELVEWIAEQPWSDGNVGMRGGSFVGWSQMATASTRPEALKAIVPTVVGYDRFALRPGGVYSGAFLEMWDDIDTTSAHNRLPTGDEANMTLPPAPPVVDADGDGELLDEFPLDKNGNGLFTDDYRWPVDPSAPPQYADGFDRPEHLYFNATMEHVLHPDGAPGNLDTSAIVEAQIFRDYSTLVGPTPNASRIYFGLFPDIAESGVAIYNVAGWWDAFARSSLQIFATLRPTNPSRVIVFPMYHQGLSPEAAATLGVEIEVTSRSSTNRVMLTEHLRWYDRWLKGRDNGIDREPPVNIYVFHGGGWRRENEWPLAREQRTRFYAAENGALVAEEPERSGTDDHLADFTHNSGWGPSLDAASLVFGEERDSGFGPKVFYRNRQQMIGVPETAPFRTEQARQSLTYTTAPLEHDTEVTGHPIVHFWASSTEDHGDLFFYLEDVEPDGESILVTEHPLRVGFDQLIDDDDLIDGGTGMDLKPDLPWHGFRKRDYTDGVFADGAVVEVITDLQPISWVFREGHRIRVSLAAADWPTFELHPELAPQNDPEAPDTVVPTITIHRGPETPSHIELPIIPNDSE